MTASNDAFEQEVAAGQRFRFGQNWSQFVELIDADRIADAEKSLVDWLGMTNLSGKSFLDIGSGSGLFSLAARRLGARVHSIDFDPDSVACTERLRHQYFPGDADWEVTRGSVLDRELMARLGTFDVVYSWGVLHHTGDMDTAISNALERVGTGGVAFLALYRKTWLCPLWKVEKRVYCSSPQRVQKALCDVYGRTLSLAYRLKHRGRKLPRGMDHERDVHDWLGGYPYESITPRDLKDRVTRKGFKLIRQAVKSEGVHLSPGCDEYVFKRV